MNPITTSSGLTTTWPTSSVLDNSQHSKSDISISFTHTLEKIDAFLKGSKTSLLILGDFFPSSFIKQIAKISTILPLFYIDFNVIKDTENAIEETLEKNQFDKDKIKDLKTNSFLFIFANCYPRLDSGLANLGYRIQINRPEGWHGKLISLCNPFILRGEDESSTSLFMPMILDRTEPSLYQCCSNMPLTNQEIEDTLKAQLSEKAQKYVETLELFIPGFWELIATPSFLYTLIELLSKFSKEMELKAFYKQLIDRWLDLKIAEFKKAEISIPDDFKRQWHDFYTKLAKTIGKSVNYKPSLFEPNKLDRFFNYDDHKIALFLRCAPLQKKGFTYSFLPTFFSYFTKGEPLTLKSVEIFHV